MDEKELEALKTSNPKAYELITGQKAELEKLKTKPPKPDPEEDPEEEDPEEDDLGKKAARERASKDKDSAREKRLESALRFNMSAKDFLKQNESLLPTDVADIFTQAEKEKFEDAVEKDEAIKSGLIQAFFRVQANVDLLTSGQKSMLDGYLKLTKNGKQEKAQQIYDMVFEPAFERLKSEKKAEALKRGHGTGSEVESGYKQRLIEGSKKHYLGEKHGT